MNRYENFQHPGNLWYHDHSMHATKANVALGLAGDYIIYDKNICGQLPAGEFEIFIVAGENYNQTDQNAGSTIEKHGIKYNPQIPFVS